MPRHYIVTCPVCGQTKRGTSKLFCSRECYEIAQQRELEARIGEPIYAALARLYVLERRSYREITALLNINTRTLMRHLRKCGFVPREGGEAVATQWENNPERRTQQSDAFRRRRVTWIGSRHQNWTGGISYKYSISAAEWCALCQLIRKRDKFRCTRCDLSNADHFKKYGRCLEVHHIVPYTLSRDNSPNNLRSLCLSCHHIVEPQFKWLL